mgnify:CR=1 FL=1
MTCSDCMLEHKRDWRCRLGFHDFDPNMCFHERPIVCRRGYCHNEKDFRI